MVGGALSGRNSCSSRCFHQLKIYALGERETEEGQRLAEQQKESREGSARLTVKEFLFIAGQGWEMVQCNSRGRSRRQARRRD